MKTIGKVVLILTAICILSFGLAAGLFFMEEDYIRYSFDNPHYSNVQDIQKSMIEGINEIEVKTQSTDIIVEVIEGKEAIFNLTGYHTFGKYNESIELLMTQEGNKLIVEVVYKKPRIIVGFNVEKLDLYVGIPKEYVEGLVLETHSGRIEVPSLEVGELILESNSGRINFEGIDSETLLVKSNSGSINGANVDSNIIELVASSGRIEVVNFTGNSGNIETNSGSINLENIFIKELGLKASSGRIEVVNSFLSSAETSSGSIYLNKFLIDRDLNLKASSGRVSVNYLEGSSFILETKQGSGNLKKDFESQSYGRGENNVFVETGSGSISFDRF